VVAVTVIVIVLRASHQPNKPMQTPLAATSPEIGFRLIRASDITPVPWKNGGGTTRQVAIFPEDASLDTFSWRVSAADVGQAGPFSIFPGIDRCIVVTRGESMVLVDAADQSRRGLRRGEPFAFAGEAVLAAELPAGPIRDFNLMVRRDQGFAGELAVRHAAQRLILSAGSAVLHCVEGVFTVLPESGPASGYRLAVGDSLLVELPAGCRSAAVDIVPEQDGAMLIDARIRKV